MSGVLLQIHTALFTSIGQRLVGNVSSGHLSAACINIDLSIVTNFLMVLYAAQFFWKVPTPLNLIFYWFFENSTISSEVFKTQSSVWYTFITTPWLWTSLFNVFLPLIVSVALKYLLFGDNIKLAWSTKTHLTENIFDGDDFPFLC